MKTSQGVINIIEDWLYKENPKFAPFSKVLSVELYLKRVNNTLSEIAGFIVKLKDVNTGEIEQVRLSSTDAIEKWVLNKLIELTSR